MKQTIVIISIIFLLFDLSKSNSINISKIKTESNAWNCVEGWIDTNIPDLGCVHFAIELMQWNKAQDYCGHLIPYRTHMVEIFSEEQHTYLQEKVKEYETFVGKVSWGIGLVNVGGIDFPKWIWSNSLRTPDFTHWNGTKTPSEGFSAAMSSNEYDSGTPYINWNPVPIKYECYPICQYNYIATTTSTTTSTTTIFKTTTTDMSTCGKDCSSNSDCQGTCWECYWSNLTERFR